jgi:competence protein ComEC
MATAAVALCVIVLAPDTGSSRPAEHRLRVSMIDVGQGDATLVQLPNGDALLIDAGGAPGSFDIGARVVTPAAWALGVRRLTWLALTHPDLDHIGGAVSVAEDLRPREIWEGVPVPRDADLRLIRRFADTRGIPWRTVRSGARLTLGPITLDIVHPPIRNGSGRNRATMTRSSSVSGTASSIFCSRVMPAWNSKRDCRTTWRHPRSGF